MVNNTAQKTEKVNTFAIDSEAQIALQELMAAKAAKGDKDALSSLCDLIAKSVLFRMSRMLRSHADAEDAAQETLIRVCKSIKQLKNPKTFRKWLGTIIVNEARRKSMQNSKLSNNIIHLSDLAEAAMDEDESVLPEQIALTSENRKVVMEAIGKLPQRQKEAILLHYYDRLNVTETAEVMGVSQPAATIHLKEARIRIKRDIESSAGKLITAMQGFVAIPFGDMLSRTLYTEGATFIPANQTWMADTLTKCEELVMVGAVAAGGAAGAAGAAGIYTSAKGSAASGTASSITSTAKTLISIVAASVATLAITFGVVHWQSQGQKPADATGNIIFTSENEVSHINPTSATALSDSRDGELYIHQWSIQNEYDGTVLYTGKSNTIDEDIFSIMYDNRLYGDYELIFIMEDANGTKYELAHNFAIREN